MEWLEFYKMQPVFARHGEKGMRGLCELAIERDMQNNP